MQFLGNGSGPLCADFRKPDIQVYEPVRGPGKIGEHIRFHPQHLEDALRQCPFPALPGATRSGKPENDFTGKISSVRLVSRTVPKAAQNKAMITKKRFQDIVTDPIETTGLPGSDGLDRFPGLWAAPALGGE